MEVIKAFNNYYQEEKEKLNKRIEEYNASLGINELSFMNENIDCFKKLNSDGKLVRGILVNLGYNILKDNQEYSYDLALAYEVLQTAILIHDDIIDRDEKRRGKETIHYRNFKKYNKYSSDKDEIIHLSNSIGICMGDYGLYLSNKIISDSYQNDERLGKILSYFNNTVLNTIKGELLDVILPFQSKNIGITEKELEDNVMEIYRLKTSYYTIVGPLAVGLLLGGAEDEKIREITEFGEKVGIAFQIQDDILGIYSDQMGKVKGSDIKEFKQTILYSHICTTPYKEELLKYYGSSSLTEEIVERVKTLFIKSCSKEYAEQQMNKMYDESLKVLDNISWITKEKKEILKGIVEYLRIRNK